MLFMAWFLTCRIDFSVFILTQELKNVNSILLKPFFQKNLKFSFRELLSIKFILSDGLFYFNRRSSS